jgi:hypothetical protein
VGGGVEVVILGWEGMDREIEGKTDVRGEQGGMESRRSYYARCGLTWEKLGSRAAILRFLVYERSETHRIPSGPRRAGLWRSGASIAYAIVARYLGVVRIGGLSGAGLICVCDQMESCAVCGVWRSSQLCRATCFACEGRRCGWWSVAGLLRVGQD